MHMHTNLSFMTMHAFMCVCVCVHACVRVCVCVHVCFIVVARVDISRGVNFWTVVYAQQEWTRTYIQKATLNNR